MSDRCQKLSGLAFNYLFTLFTTLPWITYLNSSSLLRKISEKARLWNLFGR